MQIWQSDAGKPYVCHGGFMINPKPFLLILAVAVLAASCSKKAPEIPAPEPTATAIEIVGPGVVAVDTDIAHAA